MELFHGEYAGKDIDVVLTTREFVKMIRAAHISPETLKNRESDRPMQEGTGAGVIFGTTGGVMEAALRSAYFSLKVRMQRLMHFRQCERKASMQTTACRKQNFRLMILPCGQRW